MQHLLPEGISLSVAVFLIASSFFTSFLTAAFGIGGGLLMLALMAYFLPPIALIPVHGVIQLGSNTSRVFVQHRFVDLKVFYLFAGGSLVGVLAGLVFVVQLKPELLSLILAVFILMMAWIDLPGIRSAGSGAIASGGAVTTFVTMFAGATGPLVAVFLKNLYQDRKQLVATHAAAMTVQHGFKVVAFIAAGFAFATWLPLMLAMILTGYFGTQAGTRLLHHLPEKTFRLAFKLTLTVIALDLLRRALV